MKKLVQTFQRFFHPHQVHFIILGVVFLSLSFLGTFPYFNIIFSRTAVLFIVWVLAIFLLKLSGKVSALGALLFLGLCPLFLIFEKEYLADESANLAFGLLAVGTIQEFITFFREEKKGEK